MKIFPLKKAVILGAFCVYPAVVLAAPHLDEEFLGKKFGEWNSKGGDAAHYTISGSEYRTWKPHVTPTVDGGIFVSVRIDHLRGLLASNDHASLELSFGKDGEILSARSTIALQGRKITSDVIKGATSLGTVATPADRMMKMGTDLVAELAAKLLREKVSEPGRVGFPAALQHNYNLRCLAVHHSDRTAEGGPVAPSAEGKQKPGAAPTEAETTAEVPAEQSPAQEDRAAPPLQIDVQGKPVEPKSAPLPVPAKQR